jgi:hypothetical protein
MNEMVKSAVQRCRGYHATTRVENEEVIVIQADDIEKLLGAMFEAHAILTGTAPSLSRRDEAAIVLGAALVAYGERR